MKKKLRLLFIACTVVLIITAMVGYCQNKKKISENIDISLAASKNVNWKWFVNPGEFENIKLFDDNFIGVQDKSGKYGFINREKEVIVDYQYFNVLGVSEKIARVLDFKKNYRFIDYTGKYISEETFSDAYDFSEGLAAVMKNNKWGFIDTNGNLIIDYQFDSVTSEFREGLSSVEKNSKWYFIDKKGLPVFQDNFDGAQNFCEDYAGVKKGNKWGFIDKDGNLLINAKYDGVGNFSEGKAAVKKSVDGMEQWAYINKNDKIVLDFYPYDASEGRLLTVGEFKNGYALVTRTLYCLIDINGKAILGDNSYFLTGDSEYNSTLKLIPAYDCTNDSMIDKKYGFIDINGNCKVPFIFEHVSDIYGNLVSVIYEEGGESKVGIIALYK